MVVRNGEALGIGKMGVPPEKVWWPPVLLIFLFDSGRMRNYGFHHPK